MGEGISDYTKCSIDLRRQMWMAGVEEELRRLIWQIGVTGKYISAKIHESNRKLAGFKNLYGEDQLSLDRSADEILKNQLQFSGFVREYASEEQDAVVLLGKGREKYFVTADPLDGSSLVDTNLAIGTIIGIHKESIFCRGKDSMVAALYITYGPLITMVYSAGKGAHEFVLNREGEYVLSQENIIAGWDVYYRRLSAALEEAAGARRWKLMKVITTSGQEAELVRQVAGVGKVSKRE